MNDYTDLVMKLIFETFCALWNKKFIQKSSVQHLSSLTVSDIILNSRLTDNRFKIGPFKKYQKKSEWEKMIVIGGQTYKRTGKLDQVAEEERKNVVKSMSKPLGR